MKTLNVSNNNSDIEVFFDNDGNNIGFCGNVLVFSKSIYVDTRNGEGYYDVIKAFQPVIKNLANKYWFCGSSFEDKKQDIILLVLEGIPKYDPRKEMKLSSFLQMRVNRRIINELREESRNAKSATFLNVDGKQVVCGCGNSFSVIVQKDDEIICDKCFKNVNSYDNTRILPMSIFEISESYKSGDNKVSSNEKISSVDSEYSTMLFGNKSAVDEDAIYAHDFKNWIKTKDAKTARIIELIYFKDYSISAAAEEVGISQAGANKRIKEFVGNHVIKNILRK